MGADRLGNNPVLLTIISSNVWLSCQAYCSDTVSVEGQDKDILDNFTRYGKKVVAEYREDKRKIKYYRASVEH